MNINEYQFLGFEYVDPRINSCISKPKPRRMNKKGWICVGILVFVFSPLAWTPLCMSCFYDPYEKPVYGKKPCVGDIIQQNLQKNK